MKLTITVDKATYEKAANCGITGRSENCAIALAIRDIFPNASVGAVDLSLNLKNYKTGKMVSTAPILLPRRARELVFQFDHSTPEEGVNMVPVSFDIEIPERAIELIDIEHIKPLLANHPTLELCM